MAKKKAAGGQASKSLKSVEKSSTRKRTASKAKVVIAVSPPPDAQLGFPVVGVGASAGGLEAMVEFLQNMPADSGMALVIVTHRHPGHCSLLPELLRKETAMPVFEAADGQAVQPNHVYVNARTENGS